MRLAKGAFDQGEDLIIQMQPRELFGECLYQRPLPDIFLRALLLVARAVIVDVSLSFDLRDQSATAVPAGDEACESE